MTNQNSYFTYPIMKTHCSYKSLKVLGKQIGKFHHSTDFFFLRIFIKTVRYLMYHKLYFWADIIICSFL